MLDTLKPAEFVGRLEINMKAVLGVKLAGYATNLSVLIRMVSSAKDPNQSTLQGVAVAVVNKDLWENLLVLLWKI